MTEGPLEMEQSPEVVGRHPRRLWNNGRPSTGQVLPGPNWALETRITNGHTNKGLLWGQDLVYLKHSSFSEMKQIIKHK